MKGIVSELLTIKKEMKGWKQINTHFLLNAFPTEMLQENPQTILRFYNALDVTKDFQIFDLFGIKKVKKVEGKNFYNPKDLEDWLQDSESDHENENIKN